MSTSAEIELLARLRSRDRSGLIGDDVAFLPDLDRPVVTVDQQVQGVHFVDDLEPAQVARRLLAVNLSDIAAAGATPRFAWLALATPAGYDRIAFTDAFAEAAAEYGVTLAGGDLARSDRVGASLTLIGEMAPEAHPLKRSLGRPGDTLWLGGPVGLSAIGRRLIAGGVRSVEGSIRWPAHLGWAAGDRFAERCVRQHLQPEPQLELGLWLAGRRRCAALDISDGLGLDLHRLASASGVDATIDLTTLPDRSPAEELALRIGCNFDELALGGGEDYVLLFSLPSETAPPSRFGVVAIGRLTATDEVAGKIWAASGSRREAIPPDGWDHFTK